MKIVAVDSAVLAVPTPRPMALAPGAERKYRLR